MDPNAVVLEISSDEDVDWNDRNEGGFSDGDDHNWLTELLDEVNKVNYGDDSDEVVVVSESEKTVKKSKLKSCVVDLDDDCVVLDNDPNESVEIVNGDQSKGDDDDDSDDLVVVSEKGQVACRDYPHSRHLCIKFPFSTTPNQTHCEQCYCYVCDSLAPCVFWGNGSANTDHCHATDKDEIWILARKTSKNGNKPVKTVPPVDPYRPPPMPPMDPYRPPMGPVRTLNQIPRPGSNHLHHPPANYRPPNIINQNRNHILASRNKLHPNVVSNFMLRRHQNHNLPTRVHRPVFKRTGPVPVAATGNRIPNGPSRDNFGNLIRQQNQKFGPNRYLESLQPNLVNVVNGSVSYPPQIPSNVNQLNLPPLPQFANPPNPNFQSQVNSSPFLENQYYQPNVVPPLSSRPQPNYTGSTQSTYHVPSGSRADSPLVPVPDYTQNIPQGTQAQSPVTDSGFQDYGLRWPTGQDSVPTNGLSVGSVSDNLAEIRYDWIFDDQPVEPGLVDVHGPYGYELLNDSSYIDTGPIFDF